MAVACLSYHGATCRVRWRRGVAVAARQATITTTRHGQFDPGFSVRPPFSQRNRRRFYVESLEPLLIFGLLVAWQRCRWFLYWVLLVFALGCKEDMPLYILLLGAVQWWRGERRTGMFTSALAACWLIVAVTLAVPAAREADGLPTANPFWENRLSSSPGSVAATDVVSRVLSPRTAERLVSLVASAGFLPLAAPAWLVVALPGTLLNFAARPDSVQAGLTGHYLWPVLPWIFFSAVVGAHRLQLKKPAVVTTIAVLLAAATIADSPLWVGLRRASPCRGRQPMKCGRRSAQSRAPRPCSRGPT